MLALLSAACLATTAPAAGSQPIHSHDLIAVNAAGANQDFSRTEDPDEDIFPDWLIHLANNRGEPDCNLTVITYTFDYVVSLTTWPGLVPDRVVYIDASAPFGGDGSSWTNAYQSLHDALNAESFDSELVDIRIATGWYRADRVGGVDTLDPDLAFVLPGITVTEGVPTGVMRIAGGYAGRNARNPDARDLDLYPTVFTGDLLENDTPEYENYEDNTKVMFEPRLTELNGIEIEHGRIAVNELRWMTDCTVRWCFAAGDDLFSVADPWPIARDDRSPVIAKGARIVGSTFHNNRAEAYGGALTPRGSTIIANCRFLQNTAPAGGAIGSRLDGPLGRTVIQNSYFAANSATGESGGIGGAIFGYSYPIAYCTFVGNWAQDGGGFGAVAEFRDVRIRNSIFDQNFAYNGTGFDSEIHFQAVGWVHTVRACVFRHYNDNADNTQAIGSFVPFRLNISANPAFRNLLGDDGILGTLDDDPSLSTQSPAIGRSVVPGTFSLSSPDIALFDLADLDGDCARTEPLPVDMFGNPRAFESTPGEGLDGYAADAGCAEYIPGAEPTTGQDWEFIDPLLTDFSTEPIRLYVRSDAASGGDGSSWQAAYSDLCDALLLAERRVGPVEIWVAAGTYRASCERSGLFAFRVHENVTLLGGFAGEETTVDERDWVVNPTILSGDLLGNDDPDDPATITDNAHHVLLSVGPRGGGVVDGFTIRDGSPQGYEFGPGLIWGGFNPGPGGRDTAGLVYHAAGELIVRNCTLGRVPATPSAPASLSLAGQRANLKILDSVLVAEDSPAQPLNFIVHDGIGLVFPSPPGFGQLLIERCNIDLIGSSLVGGRPAVGAWEAGAIEIDSSKFAIQRNSNGSPSNLFIHSRALQSVTIRNSVYVGTATIRANDVHIQNSTMYRGGFFFTFAPSAYSAGPYVIDFQLSVSNSVFSESFFTTQSGKRLLFGNTFTDTTDPVYYEGLGDHNTTFDFANNASAFFIDPLGPDGLPGTGDEDLRLTPDSPAINTGLNEFVTSDFDLDGNPRIIGSVVDRGAYEFTGTCIGDVNGDGAIDLDDLNTVLTRFGQTVPFGDANGDGVVDMDDLSIVLAAFGQTCSD